VSFNGSEEMLPGRAIANARDGRACDAEPVGHLLMRQVGLRPNPDRIGISELVPCGSFSKGAAATFASLFHVVVLSPGVKMRRLDTDRPVTPMQNKRLVDSNRIVKVEDPMRNNVCINGFPGHPELSVSISSACAPVPTLLNRGCYSLNMRKRKRRLAGHEPRKYLYLAQSARSSKALTGKGVAMSSHPFVVRRTQSHPLRMAFTTGDQTRRIIHIDTSFVGHAPGLYQQARERFSSSVAECVTCY